MTLLEKYNKQICDLSRHINNSNNQLKNQRRKKHLKKLLKLRQELILQQTGTSHLDSQYLLDLKQELLNFT